MINPVAELDREYGDCSHIVSERTAYPALREVASSGELTRAYQIMRETGHRPAACLILAIAERING